MVNEKIDKVFYKHKFTLDDGKITVLNQNNEKCIYKFINNKNGFVGHSDYDVIPNMWVATKPSVWAENPNKEKVLVEIIEHNKMFCFEVNLIESTITDITDPHLTVENFEIQKKGISVLIAAHGVQDYILQTIDSILESQVDYVDLEILVGVDNDRRCLSQLSNGNLSDKVKVYFSSENVGPYIITNSLMMMSKHDTLIIFGGDDFASKNMLSITSREIDKCDILRWNCKKIYENNPITTNNEILEMPGCFAIRKKILQKVNGFKPWRVQADDEFKRRVDNRFVKNKINEVIFEYLIRQDSLSRSSNSHLKSELRLAYINLIEKSYNDNKFSDPIRLHTTPLIRCV